MQGFRALMPLVCFLFIVFLINNSTIDLVPLFLIVAAAVVFFFLFEFFCSQYMHVNPSPEADAKKATHFEKLLMLDSFCHKHVTRY